MHPSSEHKANFVGVLSTEAVVLRGIVDDFVTVLTKQNKNAPRTRFREFLD